MGAIYFIKLPKKRRASSYYWLPFLILTFTVFYENFGAYSVYNFEFNKAVNALLGNTENPRFNLWLYNFFNKHLNTILYLFLIKSWIEPSKKKLINWMIILFLIVIQVLQFSGLERIYSHQPIISAIGANLILVGSGLYFIGLISNDNYLNSNPLRLISFWQMTLILFTYSLTYINSVALLYLWNINKQLVVSLSQIDKVLGSINLSLLVVTVASPYLIRIFEKEPNFDSNLNSP
ncbi:MAG: hypothetical protein ACI9UV_000409 [Algoriphagus sp.]|jgi:hypothetical protein